MTVSPVNFYARWRAETQARFLLRERDASGPPERLLQAVWHHQRLRRDQLHTVDGQPVRILHPGFWNKESGPDFRGAVVQFGQEPARSGDIEIDLSTSDWRGHNHDKNPAFSNVILHVVWQAEANKATPSMPSMTMEEFLDAPIADLRCWIGSEAAQGWPDELLGECCGPLRNLSPEQAVDLLHQAAHLRLQRKANELESRARQAGWEQALWEGLFRALGYKQNVWPMQRVAELLPCLAEKDDSLIGLQARAFGIAGLLSDDVAGTDSGGNEYLRSLWDHWWRERERFSDLILPKAVWRFNGLRPANQPQRRLALATHWLGDPELMSKLEKWFTTEDLPLEDSLLKCLQPEQDAFWSWHWNFRSPRLPNPQPLLGASRLTDLAINVILPWFWIRARSGRNPKLEQVAEKRYFSWPAGQDNALLRLARQRLFGQGTLRWLKTAAAQQGMLQIVRDCCEHSNSICAECPFPDLVRSWVQYQSQTKA